MKILLYKDNMSTMRGADHLVSVQASELRAMGHEVTLATCPTGKELSFRLDGNVKLQFVTRQEVRDFAKNFDVCVAAGSNEIVDLTLAGKVKPPIPTVTEMLVAPKGFFKWKRFIRNWRIKRAFDQSDVITIPCASYERDVRKFAKHPQVKTIGHWSDIREPGPEELDGSKRTKTIVYPAAFNRRKNQLLIIRAFAQLAKAFPDWELHLYGFNGKDYARKCAKQVQKSGLEDRIKFFPFTKDLSVVYAGASILGFPSLLEGIPLTIVEGAKFGLPIVVVDKLPGAVDMVEDGKTGIIARGNAKGLANALAELMGDDGKRAEMGDNARKWAQEFCTKERIMGIWNELLNSLRKD